MSSEQNAMPDQLAIDDQLIAIVRVARALGYDDAAEWIPRHAMAQVDKEIAEVSEPRKCVQTVNRFGYPLSKKQTSCAVDESWHGALNGDCDDSNTKRAGCEHHDPLYDPPASEPSRTDAVKEALRRSVHRTIVSTQCGLEAHSACHQMTSCDCVCHPLLDALADAERKLSDATWGHCSGHMRLWRELSDLVAENNSDDDPCVGCAFVDANRYIHELHKAIVDDGPDGDPIVILREQREGAVRESKIAYERIETLTQQVADAEKRAKDAEQDRVEMNTLLRLTSEERDQYSDRNAALTRQLAVTREGLLNLKTKTYYAACGKADALTPSDIWKLVCDVLNRSLAVIDAPAGEEAEGAIPPRVIDGKFTAAVQENAGRRRVVIIKTSSGEIVPEDEPLMLQRGRDHLMLPMLQHYRKLSELDGCNDYHMAGVDRVIARFADYASDPSRMKQPGVTRGAAWTPPDSNAETMAKESAPAPSTILPATHIAIPDSSFPVSGTGGAAQGSEVNAVPMVLHCPKCKLQHIDIDDATGNWATTRLHRKHLCKPEDGGCGHVWRPFGYSTVGVKQVPPSAQPFTAKERAHCVDCGMLYGGDDWLDLTLPDDQWALIQSPDKKDGILCANCIVRRAKKVPHADAIRAVISIMPQRDDALERAAKRLLVTWDYGHRGTSLDESIGHLRSVLAQHARRVE